MTFDVEMSFEQFFECNRLVSIKSSGSRRIDYLAQQYVYPVLAVIFALLGASVWMQSGKSLSESFSASVGPFAASLFFLWCRFLYPRRVRRYYGKQAQDLMGTMTVTEEGVRYQRKNSSAVMDYKWGAFEAGMERADMFLLFTSTQLFFRIPKDKLTPAEQDEVRGWIRHTVKLLS